MRADSSLTNGSPDTGEKPPSPLGRVVATERRPNTPHEFHFWTALDSPVGIGTIVRVDGAHPIDGQIARVFGVVTDGLSYTDLATPMHDVMGHDGAPGTRPRQQPNGRRSGSTRPRSCAVPEEPLQPVPMGEVHLAGADDVALALRMDSYLRPESRTAIPVGVYRAGATNSPIYLDADFLVGPEAAHLNITGVSGLATKTSAVEFLLSSIFTHFPASKGSVAALCFNVKGPDLCFLDQPGKLEDSDREMYKLMGIEPKPFDKVHYYAPYTARGFSLHTLRSHPDLVSNVTPLTWGLTDVLRFAPVLLNRDDVDAKADALIDFISDRIVDHDFSDESWPAASATASDLRRPGGVVPRPAGSHGERRIEAWRTHHVATIRKIRNRLIQPPSAARAGHRRGDPE